MSENEVKTGATELPDFEAAAKAIKAADRSDAQRGVSFIKQLEDVWGPLHKCIHTCLKMSNAKNLSASQKERMGLPKDAKSPYGMKWAKIIGALRKVERDQWDAFVLWVTRRHEEDKRLSFTSIRTAADAFFVANREEEAKPLLTADQIAKRVLKLCHDNNLTVEQLAAALDNMLAAGE